MTNKHISPQILMTEVQKKNFRYYNPPKNDILYKYLYVMVFIVLPLICTDLNKICEWMHYSNENLEML